MGHVPTRLSTDALVKRVTLSALIGLVLALFLPGLWAALIAVAVLYTLLVASNTAG